MYLFDGALCSSNVHPFLFFSTSPSIIIAIAFLISHAERKLLLEGEGMRMKIREEGWSESEDKDRQDIWPISHLPTLSWYLPTIC
jgi:hypothetical protein